MASRNYVEVRWVEEGMSVWLPWNKAASKPGRTESGTALRCTVAVAAGHHARIVNSEYGVDGWYPISFLYVPPDAPAAH